MVKGKPYRNRSRYYKLVLRVRGILPSPVAGKDDTQCGRVARHSAKPSLALRAAFPLGGRGRNAPTVSRTHLQ